MIERDEEAGESGLLEIRVGGRPVRLPILPWRKASEWRQAVARSLAAYTPTASDDPAETMDRMVAAPIEKMLEHLLTFDRDGVLGDRDDLEQRIFPGEIKEAFERCCDVADPFGDLSRLADRAYGGPLRAMLAVMSGAITDTMLTELRQAASQSSPSANGASRTTASARNGQRSSSGSGGSTRKIASLPKPVIVETPSQTESASATQKPR
jgi:hypothetical protein